jgi:hypothetical protein
MRLRLRPLRIDDESAATTAQQALAKENFPFLLGWDPDRPWESYAQRLENRRRGLRCRPIGCPRPS